MLKKICVLMLIFLCTGLFAVPGIKPLVPDVSGQFVYYRDYTFPNETYIGILHYDEGTYAVRFYSCENGKTLKDITIYVTMNTASDYIDLTGERIVGTTGNQNIDILNYLHDFLYEFAGRRKKLNDRDFSDTVIVRDDYPQFGGSVKIEYDFYIPIFNVFNIQSESNEILFEAVCMGKLTSSNDKVFSDFKGIKHAEVSETGSGEIPTEDWVEIDDNLWLLGDNAIYTKLYIASDEANFLEENGYSLLQEYACSFLSSNDYWCVLLDDADIIIDNESLLFVYETYDLETGSSLKTIKSFSKIDSSLLELTEEEAEENYTYFVLSEIIAEPSFFNEYEDYLLSLIAEE
ncbi:MAG: hypothetical protein J5747_07950 [Spirochaetaceae bacterium]|nr:hypothetical protein [Spirochaetaceae bacterium]